MNRYIISRLNWDKLLTEFATLVQTGDYAKLPYNEWRRFGKNKNDVTVEMSQSGNYLYIYLDIGDDNTYCHCISIADSCKALVRSFDEYFLLYWHLYTNSFDYNNKEVEEKKTMKFNFDFGPVNNDTVRMSIYGPAIKNVAGDWVAYDKNSKQIMDVDVFNFDGSKFIYKMPVALKDVKEGDVIVHNRKAMIIEKVSKEGFWAIDPREGEKKNIMPTKSMFGFDFLTKIVSFIDFSNTNINADNPFGNVNTLMMLAMMDGETDMASMLPFMVMSQGQQMNPMMMLLLMKDNDNMKDMLPMMFMLQNSNTFATTPSAE